MDHFYHLGYAEVPTRIQGRDFIAKTGKIQVVGEDPRHYPPLIALALNPELIEFLIEELPHNDGFTKELVALRDRMKDLLWERVADR